MQMINDELFKFVHLTYPKVKLYSGLKFNYALRKNFKLFNNEIDELKADLEPTENYKKYQIARDELCKKYATKDDKGNFVQVEVTLDDGRKDHQYRIEGDNKVIFDKELEKLKSTYKKDIEIQDKKVADFNKALLDPIDKKVQDSIHMISIDVVPDDIKGIDLEGVEFMVTELQDEIKKDKKEVKDEKAV